jgi:hypothetical protein
MADRRVVKISNVEITDKTVRNDNLHAFYAGLKNSSRPFEKKVKPDVLE